ncbi:MAG: C40 family peptidase [Burkholderiales bacterium]
MKIFRLGISTLLLCVALPAPAAESTAKIALTRAAAIVSPAAYLDYARELTMHALALIGVNYKFGSNSPEAGFDCSGLVSHVFQEVAGIVLPRNSQSMSKVGEKIAPADLQPGDLVFFNTRRQAFSHVGIYIGEERFVHAPRRGREVEVGDMQDSYWKKHFNGARRVVASD